MNKQPPEQTAPGARNDQEAIAISQAMQQAAMAYTRGEWAEAERVCRKILAAQGEYFDALNLLGIIAAQSRRTEEAADLLGRAVSANPGDAAAHSNYGNVLRSLKRFEEALESYARALKIKPDYAEAHNNRGNTLQELKRFEGALESYERALKIKSGYAEAHNNRGVTLQELKRFHEALESYERALKVKPGYAEAHNNRGNTLQELKRFEEALETYERALKIKPDYAAALNNRGVTLQELKRFHEALESYERALKIKPDYAEAHNNRGNTLRELKRFGDALDSYARALKIQPDYAEAHNNRGNTLRELKRFEEALESYERALQIKPDYAEAHNNRGATLQELKRFEDALGSYARALKIKPDYAEAHNNRGVALQELKRFEEALDSYARALKINPDYAEAHNNRGNTLRELKRFEEALDSHARAIEADDHAEAHNNRGITLQELKRFEEALDSYARALKIKPDYAEAYNNRGATLQELRRVDEALDSYARALKIKPNYSEAHNNRGNTLRDLKRFEEALDSYERALTIQSNGDWLYGTWLHAKMQLCNWSNFEPQIAALAAGIERAGKTTLPFSVLALIDCLTLQRQAAETWVREKYPPSRILPPLGKRRRGEKIRIGYYSADYHGHATAYLIAELFERHDKKRFELLAFSYGSDERDDMRMRLSAAFAQFLDVRMKSDIEVARISRELGIDIAVDLKGFTQDARTGIFSCRAAPIQVNYLGYPGTMGASYIDYIIADQVLIPQNSRQQYSERIVYLPHSYQANDSKRRIADKEFVRAELGLPATGFVFCCFNNNYKITPGTFDSWMRILKQVEGSVLWLLVDNETAALNLRREARARDVDAGRLIFAARMALPEHLARHRAADLFIDTLPCNAHTTASDALWAGLPVLTRTGESFAARVAASLLYAIGLPELVTTTQEQYESTAIELAGDPGRLAEFKDRLHRNRLTMPLFDTERFTRHVENAYTQMYERYQADLSPEHIYIAP
jgi:protein O-GlcNAc transferase